MSALPQALPLALSAAVYPPALLVLLLLLLSAQQPRRLVLAYYGGAAILTIGAGLIALAIFKQAGLTTPELQDRQRRDVHPGRSAAAGADALGVATKGSRPR